MKPHFLIFPCILSDETFETIKGVRDKLNACHLELAVLCNLHADVRYLKIDCIVGDLSEVLKNQIEKGWRYNSYVLNLSIVKLDYAISIASLDLIMRNGNLLKELVQCYEVLSQILSDAYVDYADSVF